MYASWVTINKEDHMHTHELDQPVTRQFGGLAADDYGHDDHRPGLLLLHGMTFDRTIWRPLVAELQRVDPGRHVVAIDLPGHGQSPDLASYELAGVADILHAVVVDAGMAAPVVVGHSAGALGATAYAAQYPTRGFVDVDQPLQLGEFAAFVGSLAEQLRGPGFPAVWQMFYDSFHTEFLPPATQDLVRSTCRPRQQVVLGFWQQILDGRIEEVTALVERGMSTLRASGAPYLHIAGDEPGPGYRTWLSEQIPIATIEVWPRTGHFPHLARPEEFAERLAATAAWPAR